MGKGKLHSVIIRAHTPKSWAFSKRVHAKSTRNKLYRTQYYTLQYIFSLSDTLLLCEEAANHD